MTKIKFAVFTAISIATAFTLSCSNYNGGFNGDSALEEAKLLEEAFAKYPVQAKMRGVSGYAKIEMVIDVNGNVSEAFAIAVEPEGFGFETEALNAVRQYKFSPALAGGVPVRQRFTKEFKFVPNISTIGEKQ